jgi:hypothetical protein
MFPYAAAPHLPAFVSLRRHDIVALFQKARVNVDRLELREVCVWPRPPPPPVLPLSATAAARRVSSAMARLRCQLSRAAAVAGRCGTHCGRGPARPVPF